ncbi:MAG: hypothetical protein ACOYWZ_18525 [Bacillota bacterium]
MTIKYSAGFLIASLIQVGIIMTAEALGISSLNANLTFMQLLVHIMVGQITGFILLFVMRNVKAVGRATTWVTGIVFGFITWWVLLSINSTLRTVQAPWNQGLETVISSLAAFIVYGVISTYTIKRYGRRMIYVR